MTLAPDTKRERVEHILDAAERLIRKRDAVDFTMLMLADEADVSPATPFNLLGSKRGVVRALMERSMASEGWVLPKHPIEQLFRSWELIAERYEADETYYRALMAGAGVVPEAALLGMAMIEAMLNAALAAGSIVRDAPVRSLAEGLELMCVGLLALWSCGTVPSERLTAQFHHSMAVALSTVVTDESRTRVAKRLRAAQRILQRLGPLGG